MLLAKLNIQRLDERHHVFALHKGHLQVKLRELRLPVGPLVLVPKTTRNLVIAIQAGHHQELLELLRRLRQRIKLPWVQTARHEVVARAFRRRGGHDGSLDVEEVTRVEEVAHVLDDAIAQHQVIAHAWAAQIEVAVAQAQRFVHATLFMQIKRWRLCCTEHLDGAGQHFNRAGGQVGICSTFRSQRDGTLDGQHVFRPSVRYDLVRLGRRLRVAHDLGEAIAVTQINENQPAMIATPMQPAGEHHTAISVSVTEAPARIGAPPPGCGGCRGGSGRN